MGRGVLKDEYRIRSESLFPYVVASGSMRHIDINEREIILKQNRELGWVIQGSVPHCGPACDANLSHILLEVVMSCEDCQDPAISAKAIERFGQRLGQIFVDKIDLEAAVLSDSQQLSTYIEILLNSMDVPFETKRSPGKLNYTLARCPLLDAARETGLVLWMSMARRAFIALCKSVIQTLQVEWTLVQPLVEESDDPLLEIWFVEQKRT